MRTSVFHILIMMLAAAGLSACSSFGEGEEKVKLEGERERVLSNTTHVEADEALQSLPVRLPTAVNLRDWGQTGAFADHAPMHVLMSDRVTKAWEASVGPSAAGDSRYLNAPVVADGRIFVLNPDGDVVALDLTEGKRLWEKSILSDDDRNIRVTGGLAVVGGTLYATTGTGDVIAMDPTRGDEIWRTNVGAPIRSAPAVAEGKVFALTHNNRLSVLSSIDGGLLWTHSGIEEAIGILGGAPPAISEGTVVVPYSSGEIYALNTSDGSYKWHEVLTVRMGADPYSALVDVEAPPVIIGEQVYAVNHNGRLGVYDVESGRRMWERRLSSIHMPWVAGNMVFLMADDNRLMGIHRKDGRVKWIHDLGREGVDDEDRPVFWFGPVLAGERLIVASDEGYAASISPYTGEMLSLVEIDSAGMTMPPIVANEKLIFLTNGGDLVVYE